MKIAPSDSKKLTPAAQQFIGAVLALQPKLAVFDCDGTLWSGDAGADFFYWEIERGLLPPEVVRWAVPRYEDYKAGKVDEETMCGEMVTINAGLSENLLEESAEEFFSAVVERRIFPEMQELTRRLAQAGCNLWAVSSTNEWAIRAGLRRFAIPADHVLAVSVKIENGVITDRLIQVPTDEGKAAVIRRHVSTPVDLCFGNTLHDAAMLQLARHAFAINPAPELEVMAAKKGWRIYRPSAIG